MDAIEHLKSHAWKTPRDYGGFSPVGDYVLATRTRDSDDCGYIQEYLRG